MGQAAVINGRRGGRDCISPHYSGLGLYQGGHNYRSTGKLDPFSGARVGRQPGRWRCVTGEPFGTGPWSCCCR